MESRWDLIQLKASLLSYGVAFPLDAFAAVRRPFYDNQFVYGVTSRGAVPDLRFPQLLCLGSGIVVALLRRESSPWKLRIVDERVFLECEGRPPMEAHLPERPRYFDTPLSGGHRPENVIAVAGEDTPGFFFYPYCSYFDAGVPCSFCGLKVARRTAGRRLESAFTDQTIRDATAHFMGTEWRPIRLISISTGTCHNDEEYRAHVVHKIAAMTEALPFQTPVHLLTHPPDDFRLIDEYRAAGVTSIAFNLEVFDRATYARLCPGKEQYGYAKWLDSLEYARELFGNYKVFCGLVWGLEPAEKTMEGNHYFMSRGIGIASNVFHADPTCAMRRCPHPSTDQILSIIEHQMGLYRAFPEARTIFPVSMRSTLDWEVMQEVRGGGHAGGTV
jgi:hypothetical protein